MRNDIVVESPNHREVRNRLRQWCVPVMMMMMIISFMTEEIRGESERERKD
jgi:hypothetical protein